MKENIPEDVIKNLLFELLTAIDSGVHNISIEEIELHIEKEDLISPLFFNCFV